MYDCKDNSVRLCISLLMFLNAVLARVRACLEVSYCLIREISGGPSYG